MARQERKRSSLGLYHVMVRGINRQQIFEDRYDYQKFLEALVSTPQASEDEPLPLKPLFRLYAYCLMNNHVHLLIHEGEENISQCVKRIENTYVSYYNRKYERVGHLFQDRFRSEPIEDKDYFITVLRYIHQNPVKAGLCAKPQDYHWSSCREYMGLSDVNLCFVEGTRKFLPPYIIAELMEQECTASCLDEEDPADRQAASDERIWNLVDDYCGCKNLPEFQRLPRRDQREICMMILENHPCPMKQLSRLTGVPVHLLRYKKKF